MEQDTRVNAIIRTAAAALSDIPGVVGVVLGGSRANGTAIAASDIDIGIYYDGANPPATEALSAVATAMDDDHRPDLVVPYGGWGPWVDAGGWMTVGGFSVDLILRDIHRVEAEIENGRRGIVTCHYQTGHPHAFLNVIYRGEMAVCRIIADPRGVLAPLQTAAQDYPPALQSALTGFFLFEAGFSLDLAEKTLDRDDTYYVAAHLVRSVSAMNQVLFAVNRTYCLNEKKAVARIDGFRVRPKGYRRRIDTALTAPATTVAIETLRALLADIQAISASN